MSQPTITHIKDLIPDGQNARKHNPRNVGMIQDALQEVGAARSIVIDEAGTILAGNATVEAAAAAGITRVQVVDADGETLIAVRRKGLTAPQKTRLALYDNRGSELATWDAEQLAALQAEDAALLAGLFRDDELAALLPEDDTVFSADADPFADYDPAATDAAFVPFKFGDYGGRVSRAVYDMFVLAYRAHQQQGGAVLLDDVLREWLLV